MINKRMSSHSWFLLGGVLSVILLAVAWFMIISPDRAHTGTVRRQTASAEDGNTTLRSELAQLAVQNQQLPSYQRALKESQLALPTDSNVTPLLRALQALASARGVSITGFTVSPASNVTNATITLPVTLIVGGRPTDLEAFLGDVQRKLARAIQVGAVTETTDTTNTNIVSMTLALQAFVVRGSTPS